MNHSKYPKVTVLMPVYNGERYLREAMDSILNQTFTNFEFLIINDGSTDRSVEIIESYGDPRIRLVHNETNVKLIATLNKGFDTACGEYIARMDCDDISLPKRLEKQVAFMDAHPEVGVCGTWAREIDSDGKITDKITTPVGQRLEKFIWRPSPILHPTAMIRNTIFKKYKYNQDFIDAEDYELWLRVSKNTVLHNLRDFLLLYRMSSSSITSSNRENQLQNSYKAYTKYYGSDDISYEEFLSFMYANTRTNPLTRSYNFLKIKNKNRMNCIDFITDNLRYTKVWLKSNVLLIMAVRCYKWIKS